MAEQTENGESPNVAETSAEDDWAAAMAEQAIAEATPAANAQPAQIFPAFGETDGKASMMNELDMILDIPVQIAVELGRTKITIKNLLQLAHGSVVELDAMAGEPMSVFVNGTLIAQGEVVVVNDKFGIRPVSYTHLDVYKRQGRGSEVHPNGLPITLYLVQVRLVNCQPGRFLRHMAMDWLIFTPDRRARSPGDFMHEQQPVFGYA